MKNETKNHLDLDQILTLLEFRPINRLTLQNYLAKNNVNITRPTLIRRLNYLVDSGQVVKRGRGRAILYSLPNFNPLLASPDPDFDINKDIHYNPQLIHRANNLFTRNELIDLKKISRNLSQIKDSYPQDVIKRELERFTVELAWKSSAIEGNTYTLLETEALLQTKNPPPGHTASETQMILNHKDAFETILSHPPKAHQITLSYITELHQLLTQNLNITTGVRNHAVGITGTRYLPPDNEWQIREYLQQLITTLNKEADPYSQTLIVITLLSYLQPFVDGNKRTARMLGNAILIANDLLPISYRTVSEIVYKDALITFYEQGSILPFKEIFIEQFYYAHTHYFR